MNMWGMWCTFFVPAFVGGIAIGASVMAFAFRAWMKQSRSHSATKQAAKARPVAAFRECA